LYVFKGVEKYTRSRSICNTSCPSRWGHYVGLSVSSMPSPVSGLSRLAGGGSVWRLSAAFGSILLLRSALTHLLYPLPVPQSQSSPIPKSTKLTPNKNNAQSLLSSLFCLPFPCNTHKSSLKLINISSPILSKCGKCFA